ncbi:hypothetical protein HMPREF9123_1616 [Neisseria bacilliformis ATCC BAA-1200]|uniref:Uncharacterized protein n=1 Tax=Neisseria bacilliformis ATCC BAA-1200 TaxID=888742 RepID=F2BCY5_9NEIS|nr:hypothetical protein HMPREF9123_1616 [Neisseria bacilliformis ATCC BAA-1200]
MFGGRRGIRCRRSGGSRDVLFAAVAGAVCTGRLKSGFDAGKTFFSDGLWRNALRAVAIFSVIG